VAEPTYIHEYLQRQKLELGAKLAQIDEDKKTLTDVLTQFKAFMDKLDEYKRQRDQTFNPPGNEVLENLKTESRVMCDKIYNAAHRVTEPDAKIAMLEVLDMFNQLDILQ
jgi:hypothetical protein